ncbi:hypothetical protein GCQ56_04615 [Marinifilum sp. N1E240]|uniref:hypothetical protein n=1 Tax=Marinifilum sp. N1E240 TaxID=2608082 RepID=UPI00128B6F9D|nr:hypothetical protein [Marinifilum sp. N1E240]MPQ46283.1 hypothetical protein [Marinifilum sp. N1E240]
MKTLKLKHLIMLTCICLLLGVGCDDNNQETSLNENEVGSLLNVFELKYGDSKEINDNEQSIILSINDIKDNVRVDCSLMDFGDSSEGSLNIRVHVYLQLGDGDSYLEVKSKPCGALPYKNDENDVQDVLSQINELKSAPANLDDDSYYNDEFINLFGEGTAIEGTPFKIFIAKAIPFYYNQPDANIDDYKFIFIITRKN